MGIFNAFDISASGMSAERTEMDLIGQNIANINTTATPGGGPYQEKVALFQEKTPSFDSFFVPAAYGLPVGLGGSESSGIGDGVKVAAVVNDPAPPKMVYDPHNPLANSKGYVAMPNVDLITEMTNMIQASRAYQANVAVFEAAKHMKQQDLSLVP